MTASLKTKEGVNKYYDARIAATQSVVDKAKEDIARLEKERKKRLAQASEVAKKEANIHNIHGNLKSLFGVKSKRRSK